MFDVPFCHFGEQLFPFHIVHILHHQAVVSLRGVPNDVQQSNNVGASSEIAENLDLALDLSCSDGLQDLDHTRVIVFHIQSPENLNPKSNVVSSHSRDGRSFLHTSEYLPPPTRQVISYRSGWLHSMWKASTRGIHSNCLSFNFDGSSPQLLTIVIPRQPKPLVYIAINPSHQQL